MATKVKSKAKAAAPAAAEAKVPMPAPVTKAAAPAKAAAKAEPKKAEAKKANATPVKAEVKEKKAPKKEKAKKIKMVRDSFTMPENDYAKIAELKKKCMLAGVPVKKSELLRAGLLSLSRLSDAALVKAVEQVEVIKTGRPAKG